MQCGANTPTVSVGMLIGMSIEQVAVGGRRPAAEIISIPRRRRRRWRANSPAVGIGVFASAGWRTPRSRRAVLRRPGGAVAVRGALRRAAPLVGRVAWSTLRVATAVPAKPQGRRCCGNKHNGSDAAEHIQLQQTRQLSCRRLLVSRGSVNNPEVVYIWAPMHDRIPCIGATSVPLLGCSCRQYVVLQ